MSRRTIIDLDGLDLDSGESLDVDFASNDLVVLLRVGGTAIVDGTVNTHTAGGSAVIGNVWISAAAGVAFGSLSHVRAGGLLATTAAIEDQAFLSGSAGLRLLGAAEGSRVTMASGSRTSAAGGAVVVAAPSVEQGTGASVVAPSARAVVYASASDITLTLAQDHGLDVAGLHPIPGGTGGSIHLHGTTTATEIFAGWFAAPPGEAVFSGRGLVAEPTPGGGEVVLTAGVGLARPTVDEPMRALRAADAPADDLELGGVEIEGRLRALASGAVVVQEPVSASRDGHRASARRQRSLPRDTTATAFAGSPVLASAGTAADAPYTLSPYPIEVSRGTLTSASGYRLAFDSAGRLTVLAPDSDGDGFRDPDDNCPATATADQLHRDADGRGDACDPMTFVGFAQPSDNGVVNVVTAGRTVPVRYRLTDTAGRGVADPPTLVRLTSRIDAATCAGLPSDADETYVGDVGLQYLGDGNWQFNWKTPRDYAGQCRTKSPEVRDGARHEVRFVFR